MKNKLLIPILFYCGICNANVIRVTNTGDSGSGTLREAVDVLAGNNDTILIDVKGDIVLNSPIVFNGFNGLTVVGPSPKHSSIKYSGTFSGAALFQISNCSATNFIHFGFVGSGISGIRAVNITASPGPVTFERVLFDDFLTSAAGGCFSASGSNVRLTSCSFVNNNGQNGGAIAFGSCMANIENCTFWNNVASNLGGAVYVESGTDIDLFHNTFYENTAASGGTAFYSSGATNQILVQANAVSNNGTVRQFEGGGVFNSGGGNIYDKNFLGDNIMWASQSGDFDNLALNFNLRSSILEDGFGLMYFTITALSPLVDVAPLPPMTTDGRMAPRVLNGDNVGGAMADAGACEYTPLRVISSSTGFTAGTLAWSLLPIQNTNTVNFIEFDVPAGGLAVTIPAPNQLTLQGNYIIDGFSQPGSAVPGPGTFGTPGVTPANLNIRIDDPGSGLYGIMVDVSSTNSTISGLRFTGFDNSGIYIFGSNTKVFGCEIGIDATGSVVANDLAGITIDGNNTTIGGKEHWKRNVVSGNAPAGGTQSNIYIDAGINGTLIAGNIVGLRPDGMDYVLGGNGLYGIQDLGINSIIGAPEAGNVISGMNTGVLCAGCANLKLQSNKIGMAYDGLTSKPNLTGVYLYGNGANAVVGGNNPMKGNILSGNVSVQIRVDAFDNVSIAGNLIGPDSTGTVAPVTTTHGVYIADVNAKNVIIGGFTPGERNVISGNQNGVFILDVGGGTFIVNNYIGSDDIGMSPLPNTSCGILIQPSVIEIVQIGSSGSGNVISGHSLPGSTGITISGSAFHRVEANIIGLNKDASGPLPNLTGIQLVNSTGATIGGDFALGQGNVISGNNNLGVLVSNGCMNISIRGNYIGTDFSGTADFGNGMYGIEVQNAIATTIGGISEYRNIISGSDSPGSAGIFLSGTGSGTLIAANYIGSSANGLLPLSNFIGIQINDSHQSVVGGSLGDENYIVASTNAGVLENSSSTCDIDGNYIGIGPSGDVTGMGNLYGILVTAPDAKIGGANSTVIVNNQNHGVFINGELADGIEINNIHCGTDLSSTSGIGNLVDGIRVVDADNILIGNSGGNVIIGNFSAGIRFTGDVTNSVILKNTIADLTTNSLSNQIGVYLVGGPANNQIGGALLSDANYIGNNQNEGILIESSNDNLIPGNIIGNDGGVSVHPNGIGIRILNSSGTIIGDENASGNNTFNVIGGNSGAGIILDNATNTEIYGNSIGLDITSGMILPNANGIEITNGSTANTIGSSGNTMRRNTISGNTGTGIAVTAPLNTIIFNYIGTTTDGTIAAGLQDVGIYLGAGAINCTIGGDRSTEGNLITGNLQKGIVIEEESNMIFGNIFGYSSSGIAIGTQTIGIELNSSACVSNQIGQPSGSGFEYENVIVNHSIAGIRIQNGAAFNIISNNKIGINPFNSTPLNQTIGVEVTSTAGTDNMIGEDVLGGGNTISGNGTGIKLDGAVHTFIYNNRIGTSNDGSTSAANTLSGIHLADAAFNTIGGIGIKSNLISGNTQNGILIDGALSTDNIVVGNIIGSSFALSAANPNGVGILISNGASNNDIGQPGAQLGNTICGNINAGIVISNANTNEVFNNKIGLPFKNTHGLVIQSGSSGNIIGGAASQRNVISNNDSIGVAIIGSDGNFVSGNFIGTNENGNLPQANLIGIFIASGDFNIVGNQTNFNLISSNSIAGIIFENASSNTVKNNYIGTDSSGNATFLNSQNGSGLILKNSNSNLIGGNNTIDEENVICNNSFYGIYMENSDLNEIYGNKIGINKTGSDYLANGQDGIILKVGSDNNIIGNSGFGLSNAIGGNAKGIYISASNSNLIESNFIGNNLSGTGVLPGTNNQQVGIHIDSASVSNSITDGNIISGNLSKGIFISGTGTSFNTVAGNFIGLDFSGINSLANGLANVHIADSAHSNLIGGSTALERNYIGGDIQYQVVIQNAADTNKIFGNYIGLGFDASTTYISDVGVTVVTDSKENSIGGGLPGQGNTIVGFEKDGIHIHTSNYNSILGNRIGIKPDSSPGAIDSSGVLLEGADYTWIGSYLVGSDSMNIITNCNTGVAVTTYFLANSSYGNVIGGNNIYNNTNQGIDLVGDDLVMPIDTNNSNIFIDNGGMDRPEIVSAWTCGTDGNTHVGFKFYASNALAGYHVEFYRNPVPDVSGYGEGEIYLGDFIFNPGSNYDTISLSLGQALPVGTVLTATITGVLGNTSEFSQQYVVTDPPVMDPLVTLDETCLGAANGSVTVTAVEAYTFTFDGGLSWMNGNGNVTASLPAGSYNAEAMYLNGCTISAPFTLNPGPPLPFSYSVVPDTCALGVGQISIDTTSTNSFGGSGDYIYSFNNGIVYSGSIDSTGLTAGNYNLGLQDTTLGCFSELDLVVVNEVTDVVDESFVFNDFCVNSSPMPSVVTTAGGLFSFETTPGDGALIDPSSGLISGAVAGNSYNVIYTVGVCNEKDTVAVSSLLNDDASFTMDDFCAGSPQNIVITGLPGGTFSFDPSPGDGATINSGTGEIFSPGGGAYSVKYITNGPCPDSSIFNVNVFAQPAAPVMSVSDSVYCGDDLFSPLAVDPGTYTPNWMIGSSSSAVVSTSPDFTPSSLNFGNNYIYVVLSDGGSCISLPDSINYLVSDVSVLSAGDDLEACLASEVQLNASGGMQYAWTPGDNLSDPDIADPVATVNGETFFIVTITDIYGCTKTDTVHITLLPLEDCHVETYNAFSPNNDGVNDFWIVDGIEGYSENVVIIYNRWGDILRRFENYNNTTVIWDGTNPSGSNVPSGTYYFVVDVNGSQNQTGWVQVVR